MSSTGVRRERSTNSRIADSILDADRIQIENEKIFKETGDANTANSPGAANLITAAGNYLSKSGDTRNGPFGNQLGIVEIIDDEINVSISSGNYFPVLVLNGEGGADDNLDIIIPGSSVFLNQEQIVQAGSFPITLRETVGGNILTPGMVDVILQPGDYAQLLFSILTQKWIVTWFSSNVGGGGSGVSFPIDFPEDDRGTVGASTQEILFTDSDRHSVKMIISGDVDLAFSSPPTNATAYTNIIIIQDDPGGHTVTLPSGTINKDIVEAGILTGIDEETGIVIKYSFGTFYAFLETGNIVSGGSSFSGNLSDLVIDVTKDWSLNGILNVGALAGITGITGTGSSVVISGIETYDFFQSGQSIQNKANPDGGVLYNVNDLQSHIFRAGTDEIARFEETTANIFRLNMREHSIKDTKDIAFNVGSTNSVAGSTPGIGYDTLSSRLILNVPSGTHLAISENSVVGSTVIRDNEIESDLITSNVSLLLGINPATPTVSGQFTNNGVDTFVFSGGAVRNFSNIQLGISATTELDNLTTTSINAALLPNTSSTLDFGSELLPWRIGHFREIEFPVNSSVPSGSTDTQISKNASGNMAFNNEVSGGGYLWYFQGVNKWNMTPTLLSGDFILLQNSLTFNDSTTDPVGDGEITRNGNTVKLFASDFELRNTLAGAVNKPNIILYKNDPDANNGDEIGSLRFDGNNSSEIQTQYAQILAGIGDVSDFGILSLRVRGDNSGLTTGLQLEGDDNISNRSYLTVNARINSGLGFGFDGVGSLVAKISPLSASTTLGIVVQDNVSFTVGSEGILACPTLNNTPPTSDAGMDGDLGTHKGAHGLYVTSTSTVLFVMKAPDGHWYGNSWLRQTTS